MEIIIGKTSGFCGGVKNSVTKTENILNETHSTTYCLGELIHNKQVISELEKKGLKIVNTIDDVKGCAIIRAHGVAKEIYEKAEVSNIKLIDLTCPKVLKIHSQVQDFASQNYFIFLLGMKDHPETIGTFSFCGKNACIIEDTSSIQDAIQKFKESGLTNLLIIAQTTFSMSLFDEICDIIKNSLSKEYNIHIEKSICNATSIRQKETDELSKIVDLMIVIGGKNSSNTKKLYEISIKNCKNAIHIETKDELDLNFVKKFDKIGIMAGASTPDYIISDVYNAILQ